MKAVCVYCGSSDKVPAIYLDAARQVGKEIIERGLCLVYGAGSTGMMGAVANTVLNAGGEVIGVIPQVFNIPQLLHIHLTQLDVVPDMHARKARFAELADAFIVLPGGYGTLDEFFEILTWAQIGLHGKPIGLLNTQGYFDELLAWVDRAANDGFIYPEHRQLFVCNEDPQTLLDLLDEHTPPSDLTRWLTRDK